MRLFTTSRTLAGLTSTAMLSTASSLRQPRSRRITARRKSGSTPPASVQPHAGRTSHTSHMAGHMGSTSATAANDSCYFAVALDDKVRILRSDASDHARMVLSGRMADVCAALERMC
ncbi:MAG: hypothetical protein LBE51_20255 [Acidovorax sp.]|jgi:hypothetical protein|nr:hypothetical protein [Acidovorax sp.]